MAHVEVIEIDRSCEKTSSKKHSRDTEKNLKHEISELTPDTCAMILMRNRSNVHIPAQAVKEYAEAMSAGAWIYNAQPILFDINNNLIDGRKRLMASVMSGVTFRSLIIHGVQKDTIHTIDQHRRRSYAGVLESRGIKHAATLIRTMAKLIRIERGLFGKPADHISWSRYDQVLELNTDLHEAVEISEKARGCPLHSTARPAIAYMAIAAGQAEAAVKLFEDTSDHELLPRGAPAKELALQLAHDRRRNIKPEVDEMIVMGIQALNDILNGRECESPYGWTRDYGECRLDGDGQPTSRQAIIDLAPGNLGMPRVDGYPGIEMGVDLVDAKSAMIKALQSKGDDIPQDSRLVMVHITPEIASEWISRYNSSNRKILKSHVNAIARDIRSGNWMMNAQPIAFSGNPFEGDALLLNGQHRLQAVVAADMAVEIMVATNVEKEAFMTYDVHSRHTHGKTLTRGDERVLAAAAKLQWREDNGKSPFDSVMPSATEIRHTIEKHPSLLDAFRFSRKQEMQIIGSSGILTYFVSKISREDDQLSKIYLDQLMSGENLGEGNPVNKTRTKLIGKRGYLTRKEVLLVLLESWDEYREHAKRVGLAKLFATKRMKMH
ncbi:hypothetical protein [Pseudosulfitobacter pseudonitzschiae]|uniref:hypothetical protein n=1 Tax=Pseudosulfitobacter pseudonitzschiae TaxID=1402135 RepID=UPI003B7C7880